MPAVFADVQRLSDSFTRLASDGRTDTARTLQQAVILVNERYTAVKSAVDDTEHRVTSIMKKKMNFDHNRETTLTWLRGLDKVLTITEELSASEEQRCCTLKVRYQSIQIAGH